jgi:hypothetical protein
MFQRSTSSTSSGSAGNSGANNAAANKLKNALSANLTWKSVAVFMMVVLIPWALYVNFHPTLHLSALTPHADHDATNNYATTKVIHELGKKQTEEHFGGSSSEKKETSSTLSAKKPQFPTLPVQGPIPTNGAKPLWGVEHKGTDAIFALACNYPKVYYQRFVGSLRKFGYNEDIVLAVSPEPKMKSG